MDKMKIIQDSQLKKEIPDFRAGDSVKVHVKITEEDKERTQIFEGIVLGIKGKGVGRSFTVRKISYGVGVERTFLINSPIVQKIEVVKKGKTKRAKLFYLRGRSSKQFKVDEART
jgi:large subunit ribosomal protein L19